MKKVEIKYGVSSTQCNVISDNKSNVSNSNSWINGLSDSNTDNVHNGRIQI